jgi:hypothetical protein
MTAECSKVSAAAAVGVPRYALVQDSRTQFTDLAPSWSRLSAAGPLVVPSPGTWPIVAHRPFHRKHIVTCRPSLAYHFRHEAKTVRSLSRIGCRPEGDFTHLRRNVIRGRGHPCAVRQRKGCTCQQKGVHRPLEAARRVERAITRRIVAVRDV